MRETEHLDEEILIDEQAEDFSEEESEAYEDEWAEEDFEKPLLNKIESGEKKKTRKAEPSRELKARRESRFREFFKAKVRNDKFTIACEKHRIDTTQTENHELLRRVSGKRLSLRELKIFSSGYLMTMAEKLPKNRRANRLFK